MKTFLVLLIAAVSIHLAAKPTSNAKESVLRFEVDFRMKKKNAGTHNSETRNQMVILTKINQEAVLRQEAPGGINFEIHLTPTALSKNGVMELASKVFLLNEGQSERTLVSSATTFSALKQETQLSHQTPAGGELEIKIKPSFN